MSSARRTLLTATAAGTLLGALWFVPSASATGEAPARTAAGAAQVASAVRESGQGAQRALSAAAAGSANSAGYRAASPSRAGAQPDAHADSTAAGGTGSGERAGPDSVDGPTLADTGGIDTTPYVVGGTVLLALGAGFVVYSVRRERLG